MGFFCQPITTPQKNSENIKIIQNKIAIFAITLNHINQTPHIMKITVDKDLF